MLVVLVSLATTRAAVAQPVGLLETDASVLRRCRKDVAKQQHKYLKKFQKEWSRCYDAQVSGDICDIVERDARIAAAEAKLRERIGGSTDKRCLGANVTPEALGHGLVCPAPCEENALLDIADLASCSVCAAEALGVSALDAGYGVVPPFLPPAIPAGDPSKCQDAVAKAAKKLAEDWTRALAKCEDANASGKNDPPLDCPADPQGEILTAISRADVLVARCIDFSGLGGCAGTGDIASTQACVETAVADYAPGCTDVAYP
jgi:hypothetical protein